MTLAVACLVQTAFATYPGLYSSLCTDCVIPYAAGISVEYAVEPAVPYTGPVANPVVLPTGYLADTSDVVAVRGAHLSALAAAQASSGNYASGYVATAAPPAQPQPRYTGPQASPVVLQSGYLADTSEVTAARGAHLAAVATSAGAAAAAPEGEGNGAGAISSVSVYNGPVASPVVLSSGFIADTREVSTARGAHLAAVARTSASRSGTQQVQDFGIRRLATPVIAAVPTRYVADTHEVSVTRGSHLAALTGCVTCGNNAH